MELFGQKITVSDDRPHRKLRAADLLDPDNAPFYLRGEVENYLKIAKHHGIDLTKLNLDLAGYMLKGYWEFVKKRTQKEAA